MSKGKAYLVGAGPGDEKLITVRGLELIRQADIIIYDRLANPQLLKYKKEDCRLIYVGKASSHHSMKQEDISELIASETEKGNVVVRLKGGDPYVFGRGGEEGELLFDRGLEFEVVPGVTAGIGGLAYAGIPVTHRDYGSSMHLITGHKKSGMDTLNYRALADLDGTMVFYMGVENLPNIVAGLIANGKEKSTKVALISWATYPHQKVLITSLEELSEGKLYPKIKPPVLTVIGNVVEVRDKLNFFERRLLHGKRIVVTRAGSQVGTLSEKLRSLGAEVIECPAIKITPIHLSQISEEIRRLKEYTHLLFTSQNGVRIFMEQLLQEGDVRQLAHLRIGSIGEATTKELARYSLRADVMPEKYVGEALAAAVLEDIDRSGAPAKILIPRAAQARDELLQMLEASDKVVCLKELKIYETEKEAMNPVVREALLCGADAVTFTSASTVRNFFEMIDEEVEQALSEAALISIGPITSETMRAMGKRVTKEAQVYNIDGIISATIDTIASERKETAR